MFVFEITVNRGLCGTDMSGQLPEGKVLKTKRIDHIDTTRKNPQAEITRLRVLEVGTGINLDLDFR